MNLLSLLFDRATGVGNSLELALNCTANALGPMVDIPETNDADARIAYYICVAVVASVFILSVTAVAIAWINKKAKDYEELKKVAEALKKNMDTTKEEVEKLKEEVEALQKNAKEKPDYILACEVLEKIGALAKGRNGSADKDVADKLYDIYGKIKSCIKDDGKQQTPPEK